MKHPCKFVELIQHQGRYVIVLRAPDGVFMRLGDRIYDDPVGASMALTVAREHVQKCFGEPPPAARPEAGSKETK